MKWTEEQEDIFEFVETEDGNLVVEARAGSGKTTTLLEAAIRAPFEGTALIAAFNKRIAKELQARVEWPIVAKTINAAGYGFVRNKMPHVKVDGRRGYDLARKAQEMLMKQFKAANPDTKNPYAQRTFEVIRLIRDLASVTKSVRPFAKQPEDLVEIAENFGHVPDGAMVDRGFDLPQLCSAAHGAMVLAAEVDDGVIDFDDQIWLPLVKRWLFRAFSLVVVDEVQDLAPAQIALVKAVCKKDGRFIFVGDPRQTIYEFRGASESMLGKLAEEFDCETLPLTTCFRCPARVIEVARGDVEDIRPMEGAEQGKVGRVFLEELADFADAGDFILARLNSYLVPTWLDLLDADVPAYILGRGQASPLRALVDKVSQKGTVSSIQGFQRALNQHVAREHDLALQDPRRGAAYETLRDRADILRKLLPRAAGSGVRGLKTIIAEVFPDEDGIDRSKVILSTVHKVKGLEAPRVFVMRHNLGPGNIRYVAVTRAQEELYWVEGTPEEIDV